MNKLNMGFCIILILLLFLGFGSQLMSSHLETYIIHVESPNAFLSADEHEMAELEKYYLSFMPTTSTTMLRASPDDDKNKEETCILFSYRHVFFGFAARLSDENVRQMEKKHGFLSAEKEEILSLHTTYTPQFLGLTQNKGFWKQSNYGKGIIIGVLDTGINPDHLSFSDAGMPSPPAKWKGRCEFRTPRRCNKKFIGARNYIPDVAEPLDDNGHGSHVAGTAAGNYVKGANYYGNAYGTSAGIAPLAHLAVYKVCNVSGYCNESSILAGMESAISDGVDIISMSIGFGSKSFYTDSAAIGAYGAMEKGIFVSSSAGNSGPSLLTLSNEAPWVLTVGASTIDRQIRSTTVLGNNRRFHGQSAYQPADFPSLLKFPLIYPGLNSPQDVNVAFCAISRFPIDIKGNIVICRTGGGISAIDKGKNVRNAGGRAMILINQEEFGYSTSADVHVLPASHVSHADSVQILAYLASTTSPTATLLFQGTVYNEDPHAPMVAYFSSRGPNRQSRGILKPDILGPGVEILAASRNSHGGFVTMSGTSMACPHLSGVAALLKSTHPNWSPAAIKSAMMTTSDVLNLGKNPIVDHSHQPATLLAKGSGHVNPSRANNPGLIYDLTPQDYIPYLCGLGYNKNEIKLIVQRDVDCSTSIIPQADLNYPSLSIVLDRKKAQTYTRTVTNVGVASSVYNVRVEQPQGLQINVYPTILQFSRLNQRLKYQATLRPTNNIMGDIDFTNDGSVSVHGRNLTNNLRRIYEGSITWISKTHSVRIPVVGLLYQNAIVSPLKTVPLMMGVEELLPST